MIKQQVKCCFLPVCLSVSWEEELNQEKAREVGEGKTYIRAILIFETTTNKTARKSYQSYATLDPKVNYVPVDTSSGGSVESKTLPLSFKQPY